MNRSMQHLCSFRQCNNTAYTHSFHTSVVIMLHTIRSENVFLFFSFVERMISSLLKTLMKSTNKVTQCQM